MNLKYYLRGLGIGIAVTALIIGLGVERPKETLSDAEIKARAAELGMVETSGRLSEREEISEAEKSEVPKPTEETKKAEEPKETETPKPTEEPKATEAPKPTETPKETETPTPTEAPKVTEMPKPTEAPKVTEAPKATEEPKATAVPKATEVPEKTETQKNGNTSEAKSQDTIVIEVKSGEGSYTICKKMQQAGLIASAEAFDAYLYDNGYDKKLQVGEFEVPTDAKPEEIAKILTRSN